MNPLPLLGHNPGLPQKEKRVVVGHSPWIPWDECMYIPVGPGHRIRLRDGKTEAKWGVVVASEPTADDGEPPITTRTQGGG